MKVYTKVVIDIQSGRTLYEESYNYYGPVAWCGGGGKTKSTSTTIVEPDREYNARLAKIAEEQQNWSRQLFNMFKYGVEYDPYEEVVHYDAAGNQIKTTLGAIRGYDPSKVISEYSLIQKQLEAEYGLTPFRAATEEKGLEYQRQQYESAIGLLPLETETQRMRLGLEQQAIADKMKTLQERSPLISKFYEQALSGINIQDRVARARADVEQGFANAAASTARTLGRFGLDPSSARGTAAFTQQEIAKAAALAGASTSAAERAEQEEFERKRAALGIPLI